MCELVNAFLKFVPGRHVTLDSVFNLLCRFLCVHLFLETDEAIEFIAWLMTLGLQAYVGHALLAAALAQGSILQPLENA